MNEVEVYGSIRQTRTKYIGGQCVFQNNYKNENILSCHSVVLNSRCCSVGDGAPISSALWLEQIFALRKICWGWSSAVSRQCFTLLQQYFDYLFYWITLGSGSNCLSISTHLLDNNRTYSVLQKADQGFFFKSARKTRESLWGSCTSCHTRNPSGLFVLGD